MNDEQFEKAINKIWLFSPSMADQLRARNTAQREALARVEAAYANRLRNVKQLESERDTAQAQLAEAVGLLRNIEYAQKYGWEDSDTEALQAFLARNAQAERQEAREPVLARPEHGVSLDEAMILTMDRYSGALDKLAVIEQQEVQGAQAGGLASAVRVLLEVPQLQGEQAFSAQPIIDRVRAALATQTAEWVDPVALHPAENLYNQGFADGVSEAKRLNAVRGAEHDQ